MSSVDTTVIICCAGMGTRLGIGTTKALLHIDGKPLIIHQLEALQDYTDIRVVVGYQADRVIDVVNSYRKDIMFVFNNEYKKMGAAASLCKALVKTRKYILTIDGDILIKPSDFKRILDEKGEFLAVSKKNSCEPVLVNVKNEQAIHFDNEGNYEWPGVAKIESSMITKGSGFTYEIIEKLLPIRSVVVDSRDIDTPEDYENASDWASKGYNYR